MRSLVKILRKLIKLLNCCEWWRVDVSGGLSTISTKASIFSSELTGQSRTRVFFYPIRTRIEELASQIDLQTAMMEFVSPIFRRFPTVLIK